MFSHSSVIFFVYFGYRFLSLSVNLLDLKITFHSCYKLILLWSALVFFIYFESVDLFGSENKGLFLPFNFYIMKNIIYSYIF